MLGGKLKGGSGRLVKKESSRLCTGRNNTKSSVKVEDEVWNLRSNTVETDTTSNSKPLSSVKEEQLAQFVMHNDTESSAMIGVEHHAGLWNNESQFEFQYEDDVDFNASDLMELAGIDINLDDIDFDPHEILNSEELSYMIDFAGTPSVQQNAHSQNMRASHIGIANSSAARETIVKSRTHGSIPASTTTAGLPPVASASGYRGSSALSARATTVESASVDMSHYAYGHNEGGNEQWFPLGTPVSSAQLTVSDDTSSGLLQYRHGVATGGSSLSLTNGITGLNVSREDTVSMRNEYVKRRQERRRKLLAAKERAKEKRINSFNLAREKAVAVLRDITGSTASKAKQMSDDERKLMLYKRRIRNRESAVRSRERQRVVLDELNTEMEALIRGLSQQLDAYVILEQEITQMEAEIHAYAMNNHGEATTSSGIGDGSMMCSSPRSSVPTKMNSTRSLPRVLRRNAFGSSGGAGSWSAGAGSELAATAAGGDESGATSVKKLSFRASKMLRKGIGGGSSNGGNSLNNSGMSFNANNSSHSLAASIPGLF